MDPMVGNGGMYGNVNQNDPVFLVQNDPEYFNLPESHGNTETQDGSDRF